MTNRTKVLERASVAVPQDVLQSLLDSCRRNGRPAKFPAKSPKIYFDAERFRWWFTEGRLHPELHAQMDEGHERVWSLHQWREWFDKAMKEYPPSE